MYDKRNYTAINTRQLSITFELFSKLLTLIIVILQRFSVMRITLLQLSSLSHKRAEWHLIFKSATDLSNAIDRYTLQTTA